MDFSDYLIYKINPNKNSTTFTLSLLSISLALLLGAVYTKDDLPGISSSLSLGFFAFIVTTSFYSFFIILHGLSLSSICDFIILNNNRINKTTEAQKEILLIFKIGLFFNSKKVIKKIELLLDKYDK